MKKDDKTEMLFVTKTVQPNKDEKGHDTLEGAKDYYLEALSGDVRWKTCWYNGTYEMIQSKIDLCLEFFGDNVEVVPRINPCYIMNVKRASPDDEEWTLSKFDSPL